MYIVYVCAEKKFSGLQYANEAATAAKGRASRLNSLTTAALFAEKIERNFHAEVCGSFASEEF